MFFAFALIVGDVALIVDGGVVAYNIIILSIFFSIIRIILNVKGVFVIILINILIITVPVAV